MELRELFEKLHPVPKNVVWLPSNEMYWTFTEFGETDIAAMKEQNALWKGFQSGHAAGLEDAAKIADSRSGGPCGEFDYGYTDADFKADTRAPDIADEIRAMKEPK